MDFLKILQSFEEFIFEATSWLLFYPRTLWRILRRPLATMAYSDREQGDDSAHRYDDAMSPPLTLLVTLVVASLAALALHIQSPKPATEATRVLFASPQNLILLRSLVFSLIPLVSAATLLRRQGTRLTRESLRAPFYAQCYLAAPFAAFVNAGGIIFQRPDIPNLPGLAIMLAGVAWFLVIQTRWFAAKLGVGPVSAARAAVGAVLGALAYFALLVVAIALASSR